MQPIHNGLPRKALYDTNSFRSIAVCLDSGKLATNACSMDCRGTDSRVVYVNVYNEDVPTETCDKHVLVEYCVTGKGVANEYCAMFPDTEVSARALVKMTQGEVQELRSAASVGLADTYLHDGYVYYLDGTWHGFRGTANTNQDLPYLICPKHNAGSWHQHQLESGTGAWDEDADFGDGYEDNWSGDSDNSADNGGW